MCSNPCLHMFTQSHCVFLGRKPACETALRALTYSNRNSCFGWFYFACILAKRWERPVLPLMPLAAQAFHHVEHRNPNSSLNPLAYERRRGVWRDSNHPPVVDPFLSLLLVTPLCPFILQSWSWASSLRLGYLDPCVARRLGKRRLADQLYQRQTY